MELKEIITSTKPDINSLPGGWDSDFTWYLRHRNLEDKFEKDMPFIFNCALSHRECDIIISKFMQSPNFEEVSIQGRKDVPDDRIGSIRTTAWCPQFALELWHKRIKYGMPNSIHYNEHSPTDWWQGNKYRNVWSPIGVSPMMRFMKYEKGGQHYAHYDAGFIYPDDNYRTLLSMVIYLTTNENGGATRFIKDGQDNIKEWDRDHNDWTREAKPEEVFFESKPIQGNILVFPHRMCHDVEQYLGNEPRMIIRGDILFKTSKEHPPYNCPNSGDTKGGPDFNYPNCGCEWML